MGEMASLWGYAEHGEMDELGQKLLYTSLELEKLKSEAMEEMRKNKEYVNQLIQLLKCVIEERDELRKQVGGEAYGGKAANSSITESNSLSDHSPVDSHDSGALVIENLSKGRVLPQKGMLLQAVLQAGPLLQTLMVAGPLPRWRNPPQMHPFHIPPVAAEQISYTFPDDVINNNNAAFIPSPAVSSIAGASFRLPKRQRFC